MYLLGFINWVGVDKSCHMLGHVILCDSVIKTKFGSVVAKDNLKRRGEGITTASHACKYYLCIPSKRDEKKPRINKQIMVDPCKDGTKIIFS